MSQQPSHLKKSGHERCDPRDTDELFRLFLANVVDYAIFVLDVEGRIVTWNEGAERIKGYNADEIIGKAHSIFYTDVDKAGQKPLRELNLAREYGRSESMGWRVRKDGTQFFASDVVTSLRDAAGSLRGFAIVSRDITKRKEAEDALLRSRQTLQVLNDELSEARDQAQAASKFKSEFVANMSHEIRTPMNGIIGMCNILLKTDLDSQQRQYADVIQVASSALLNVVNDILDFSKIEAGRIDLEMIEFDLVHIVESVCEILAGEAQGKKLSLMSFIDPTLPPLMRGDPERLRQILINLTANAVKFSSGGEVIVRAIKLAEKGGQLTVRFSVTDSGIGLSSEEQQKLFMPFVQADGSVSRKYGGTGLGLSISKHLTELMGGVIGVDSKKGEGATFWFEVPLERRAEQPLGDAHKELQGIKVLIIDDEPQASGIVISYVQSWGMLGGMCVTAEAGLQELRLACTSGKPYDVVIVDLSMPGMSGIEMAREMLADENLKPTKLILLTAFDTVGLGSFAISSGFSGYIIKPVRQAQLLECLQGVLSGTRPVFSKASNSSGVPAADTDKGQKKFHVLVAEDHPINQQVARLYLDELGVSCSVVANGREAVEAVANNDFDLVFMDCHMPELSGVSATGLIRKAEQLTGKHITVIAMTAGAMQGDREHCIAAGMDDYLSKPIEPVQLQTLLEKWLPKVK